MDIYVTAYGLDTRYKEYMNSYNDIIQVLKSHKVAIIVNAKLASQDRTNSLVAKQELEKNDIVAQIIDLDDKNFNINDFDAIYFSGGEPKYLMDAIIKNNYYDAIENFIENGNIIIGQSAGAMIMSQKYGDTTTGSYKILNNGFNFYHKMIIPHYDHLSEDLKRQIPSNIFMVNDNDRLIQLKKSVNTTKEFVEEWLNKLKAYWFDKDIESAVSLFEHTTFYQETPFMKPYATLEEIREEWQHIKNENIQNIEIKPLAIDGYTVIAQWILKQNDRNYDGIYEIKFNENLDCIYFKSWEMVADE